MGIVFVVTGMFVYWMCCFLVSDKWNNIVYVLIIGGVVGNVFDCIVYGFVVDYFDFYWGIYYWLVFNLVDSMICIGVVMIIFDGFCVKKSVLS